MSDKKKTVWESMAAWWDAGPKPQAKDSGEQPTMEPFRVTSEHGFSVAEAARETGAGRGPYEEWEAKYLPDGTTQMDKWKTPGFDGREAAEHSKVVRVSGAEYERLKREGEATFKQQPEIGRER